MVVHRMVTAMNRNPLISLPFAVLLFFSAAFEPPRVNAAMTVSPMIVLSLNGDMFSQSRVYLSKVGLRVTCKQGYALWLADEPKNVWMVNPDNKTYLLMPFEKYAKDEQAEYGPNHSVFTEPPEVEHLAGSDMKLRLRRYTKYLPGTDLKAPEFTKLKRSRREAEVVYIDEQPIPTAVKRHWCALIGLTGDELQTASSAFAERSTSVNAATSPRSASKGLPVGLGRRVNKKWWGEKKFSGTSDKWIQIIELKAFARQPLDYKFYAKPVGYKAAKDKTSLYLSGDGVIKHEDIEDFFQRKL